MSNIALKGIKAAAELINLTPFSINTYDKSSGKILTLSPRDQELPTEPVKDNRVFYIITKGDMKKLKDRPLDDIAIIRYVGHGRHNRKIAYFSWGSDVRKEVCLYRDYYGVVSQ